VGLTDFASKVITHYKADVSDHVKALEKLKGAERDAAQAAIDANKARSGVLEGQIKGLGKLNEAFGAATRVAQTFWEGYQHLREKNRLDNAAGFADIERLKRASGGLKTEFELLQDAAKRNSGEFKLTTQQFADAEKAILALVRGGSDLNKATDAVNQSIIALKTEGLKDLGHGLDISSDKLKTNEGRAEALKHVMQHLGKIGRDAGSAQSEFGNQAEQALVKFHDQWDKVKEKMGEVVVQMGPLLLKLAEAIDMLGKIADASGKGSMGAIEDDLKRQGQMGRMYMSIDNASMGDATMGGNYSNRTGVKEAADPRLGPRSSWAGTIDAAKNRDKAAGAAAYAEWRAEGQLAAQSFLEGLAYAFDKWDETGGAFGQFGALGGSELSDLVGTMRLRAVGDLSTPDGKALSLGSSAGGIDMASLGAGMQGFYGGSYDQSQIGKRNADAYNARRQGQQGSRLEEIFGPVSEFDVYKRGFEMLSGAIGSAMTAWIDGSMSAGQAFKKAIGEMMKATAIQAVVEALKNTAIGIGYAFTGNPKAAGAFAAAAQWGAVAVAASAGAKLLGGGGASSVGSGGAGRAAPVGGSSGAGNGGSGGSSVVYVVGDPYGDRTTRQRANDFKKQAQAAGVGNGATREG
jgi:hypothetical protein